MDRKLKCNEDCFAVERLSGEVQSKKKPNATSERRC